MNLNSDDFDTLLVKALQGAPEPTSSFDLAAEAMWRAQSLYASELRLRRIAFWRRMSTMAATLAIAVIVLVGYFKFPTSTTDESAADSALDVTTAASTIDLTTLGVAALVLTLVGIVLATLLSPERPQFRLSLA